MYFIEHAWGFSQPDSWQELHLFKICSSSANIKEIVVVFLFLIQLSACLRSLTKTLMDEIQTPVQITKQGAVSVLQNNLHDYFKSDM